MQVGAINTFGDSSGALRTTAVMFRTPAGDGLPYAPQRCDIFFFIAPGQPTTTLAGFTLSLFADDGSAQHFPGAQVRIHRIGCV